jgi:DNA-binding response OmpR family regulator
MGSKRILIVEDEESIRQAFSMLFDQMGYATSSVGSAEEALKQLVEIDFDVAIVDIVLPGIDGMHLLNEIKHVTPDTEVIIISGHASLETSIEAVRLGAYDYLVKPFDELDEVWFTVERAFEKRRLSVNNKKLQRDHERQGVMLANMVKLFETFMKAVKAANSGRSISELLTYFTDLIASELDVKSVSIMFIDDGDELLKIAAAYGITEDLVENVSLELGTGISGRVALSGKPYVLQTKHIEVPEGGKSNPDLDVEPFHVALSLPIKQGDKTIGVINVANRPTEKPFNEQDLDFLMGIADMAGIMMMEKDKERI